MKTAKIRQLNHGIQRNFECSLQSFMEIAALSFYFIPKMASLTILIARSMKIVLA